MAGAHGCGRDGSGMQGLGERCPAVSGKEGKGLPGGREGGMQQAGHLRSPLLWAQTPSVAWLSWWGAGGRCGEPPSPAEPLGQAWGWCSAVPAHPVVLLGTGRAWLGCSLTVPVIPSPVCKTLASPPARAIQKGRDSCELLHPCCPCPGSQSLPLGWGTPKRASAVLQGRSPRTEPGTELFWQRWRNGERGEEEEEARKARFPARLCLHCTAPPSLPDLLRLTSDFCHPKAVTFPESLDLGQHGHVPPREPPPLAPGLGTHVRFQPG